MISYQTDLENITAEMLSGFFVGWPNPPDCPTHLIILHNSSHIVLAVDGDSHKVIGFINAVSDNCLAAYIPLLEVLPEYQKQGIGAELVKRMLALLSDFYMIDLDCDENMQEFYAKFKMQKLSGMMIRNYDRQSGK